MLSIVTPAAAQTTYSGSATGGVFGATFTLTTFNTIGSLQTLTDADVATWSVTVTGNGTQTFSNVTQGAALTTLGTDLTADSIGLYFNYGGTGYAQFYNPNSADNELLFCSNICGNGSETYIQVNGLPDYTLATGNQQIAAADAVPEPAAWALMIGGFGIVGGALRIRRRRLALAI